MVLFKNLHKSATDCLTRDYPTDKPWEVELKNVAKNPQFTQTACVTPSGSLDASTAVKCNAGLSCVEGKLANGGAGFLEYKYELKNVSEGLHLKARAERKVGKATSDSLSVGAEYVVPKFHGVLSVDPFSTTWNMEGVYSYKKAEYGTLFAGATVAGGLNMHALKYSLGTSFVGEDSNRTMRYTVGLKTMAHDGSPVGKVCGSFHSTTLGKQSLPAELAAEVQHSLVDQKTQVSFGGVWYTDESKKSFVKAKICQDAKIQFSVTHKLADSLTATLGGQVDGMKAASPDSVKYGVKLNLTA